MDKRAFILSLARVPAGAGQMSCSLKLSSPHVLSHRSRVVLDPQKHDQHRCRNPVAYAKIDCVHTAPSKSRVVEAFDAQTHGLGFKGSGFSGFRGLGFRVCQSSKKTNS